MFTVEGKGHLIDDVSLDIAADDLEDAEATAEQALKDYYPEYDFIEVLDVREEKNAG